MGVFDDFEFFCLTGGDEGREGFRLFFMTKSFSEDRQIPAPVPVE